VCWGHNDEGQLGDGTTTNRSTPVAVSGLTDAIALSAGVPPFESHTCAVRAGGTVVCWGDNRWGQLGHFELTPVTVVGLP
jgi:alpha-tubulin suppressor-like RCC1 family protein